MSTDDIQTLLRTGIQAAQSGNKAAARRILEQVVEQAPDNELAWIWMASVVESVSERQACLQRVLEINPTNSRARQALDQLQRVTPPPAPRSVPAEPRPDSTLRQAARTRASRTAELERDALLKAHSRRRQHSLPPLLFTLIALLAVVMIAAGLLLLWNEQQARDDSPATTPPAGTAANAVPGLSPTSAASGQLATATPIGGTLRTLPPRETLPATWTPTATWTPSATPTPTATALPLESFGLLVSFRFTGETHWKLYTMRADGSGQRQVTLRLLAAPEGTEITLLSVRDAVYSPDGERIAFTGRISESRMEGDTLQTDEYEELFVAPSRGGTADRLTEQHAGTVEDATWSADGSQIAFASDADGDFDIYVIAADGGTPGGLTRNQAADRYPAWSPDGAWIAFASDRNTPGELEIFRLDVETSTVKQLTENVNSSYSPAWSPDSQSLAFLSDRRGNTDLYVMTADGAGERALIVRDTDNEERDPAWSPDGEWIAFSSNRAGPVLDLFMIRPDGTDLQRITPEEGDTRYTAWQH